MAAWIVCALCALVILKPQEFVPALAGLPLLYVLFGAAILIGTFEAAMGRIKLTPAPHVPFAAAFLAWAAFTTIVKRPSAIEKEGMELLIVLALFLAIALFVGSAQGLRLFSMMFLGCALLVTTTALVQAEAPFQCMLAAPDDWEGRGELSPDGRPCEAAADCRRDAPDPDDNYRCERVGPFGTSTIGGRVRYRGSLADPNELSLASAMAIPFALALAERGGLARKRRLLGAIGVFLKMAFAFLVVFAIAAAIVTSKSRTGVLVFIVIVGILFLRRLGPAGLVAGCMLLPPMLILGGRQGAEAEASTEERAELIGEALSLIRRSKGIGVGVGQFGDESSLGLTAHNSYLLAGAETGIIGMCLFALTLYLALKAPIAIWFGEYKLDRTLTRLAPAIAVALLGTYLGIFFLSWSYKDILYMMLGASAALYQAARAQDPRVRVKLSATEVSLVCAVSLLLLPALYLFMKIRA